jgi:hypothetical protein
MTNKPRKKAASTSGTGKNFVSPSVRAKRAHMHPDKIRERREAGEDTSQQRGFIRLGVGTTAILSGADDLSTWDDEELFRGQRKDKNGRFQGRPPAVVAKAVHDEMVRRQMAEASKLLQKALVPACTMLASIIEDPEAEDKDKLKAVGMIMDRVLGKTPETVNVNTGEQSIWEKAIVAAVVPVDPSDEVLDVDEVFSDDEYN